MPRSFWQRPALRRPRFTPTLLALEDRSLPSTVTTPADSGPGSLRDAIDTSAAGDTITFDPSLSGQPIDLTSGTLTISHDLTIQGLGSGNLTVRRDDAAPGFGIFAVTGGTVSMSGLTISNGHDTGFNAGGINNTGTLALSDVVLDSNTGGFGGGGINNSGHLTLNYCVISNNFAPVGGAGIDNGGIGSSLTATGCFFYQNQTGSTGGGGGISNGAFNTASVSFCTFAGNYASGGAGIGNGGTLTVDSCTFAYNTAWSGAGLSSSGTLTATNSTFYGNVANTFSGGGLALSGTASVVNCTVTANVATQFFGGGGISGGGSGVTLLNTIVAGNTSVSGASIIGDDIRGSVSADSSYNLIGDGTGLTGISDGSNGNQIGTAANPIDPGLSDLRDNGGPTWTVALLAYSPAIGAGTSVGAPAVDQRGAARPTPPSIGASEYVASVAVAFQVIGPASATVGVPASFTVTAVDAYGNAVTSYTGTVQISTDNPGSALLPSYTFTPSDGGTHTFSIIFATDGGQTWTVLVTDGSNTGSTTTVV